MRCLAAALLTIIVGNCRACAFDLSLTPTVNRDRKRSRRAARARILVPRNVRGNQMSLFEFGAGASRKIVASLGLVTLALGTSTISDISGANAKTPGKTYCYNRVCHRVLTLAETRRAVGKRRSVVASYYSHCKVD